MTTPTLEDLRLLHDKELGTLVEGDSRAGGVLARRGDAASAIRLALARAVGRDYLVTAEQWSWLPCVIPGGGLGLLDIGRGEAWDLHQLAPPGVEDLGLHPAEEAFAAANMNSAGTARVDGVPVQHEGTAVVDGTVVPPSMPPGWQQIALPTWRGYQGDGSSQVPLGMYGPDTWVRPTRVATGLRTCYGGAHAPSSYEAPEVTAGTTMPVGRPKDGQLWPHGCPDWVRPRSVTVLDSVLLDRVADPFTRAPVATGWDRLDDVAELERVRPLVERLRVVAVARLRYYATERTIGKKVVISDVEAAAMLAAADDIEAGGDARAHTYRPGVPGPDQSPQYRGMIRWGNASTHQVCIDDLVLGLARADEAVAAGSPWEAATALRNWAVHGAIIGAWPGETSGEWS